MTLTATAGLDAVLTGSTDRTLCGSVTIALPVTVAADFTAALVSISLDEQSNTDLPEQARDAAGLSILGGTIVIGGCIDPAGDSTKTAAWLFNPDNPVSPMYRTDPRYSAVSVQQGAYVPAELRSPGDPAKQMLPLMTNGVLTDFSLDHDNGQVTLNVTNIDSDDDETPEIPAVVTAAPYNAGLTSEYAMDGAWRSVKAVSSWPAVRPSAVLAVGMRSSVWPDVGTLRTDNGTTPTFASMAWGSGLTSAEDWTLTDQLGDDIYVEMIAAVTGPFLYVLSPAALTNDYLRVDVSATAVQVSYVAVNLLSPPPVTYALTALPGIADAAEHLIGLHISWPQGSTGYTLTLTVDGTSTTVTGTSPVARAARPTTMALNCQGSAVAALQVTNESAPASSWPFTPALILDHSLNPLQVVPEVPVGTKLWDALSQMAAAECGIIRRGGDGIARFLNRNSLLAAGVQHTLTSRVSVRTGLTTSVPPGTGNRKVQVPYSPWTFSTPTDVWQLTSTIRVPARQQMVWTQPLDGLAVAIQTPGQPLPDGHDPTDGGTWFRASADASGVNPLQRVLVRVRQISAASIEITVDNRLNSVPAYLVSPSTDLDLTPGTPALVSPSTDLDLTPGTPALWVGGTPVMSTGESIAETTFGDGKHPLQVSSNPYIQYLGVALQLGQFLLPQVYTAIRDFTGVAISPDPRIQIGHLARLQEPFVAGIDEYVSVWGRSIDLEFPPAGETGGTVAMALSLRALGPPGAWLLGVPGRSELDGTTAPDTAWLY